MKLGNRGFGVLIMLLGIFTLMKTILQYLMNLSSYYFPPILGLLTIIITGLFYLGEYYNKNFYLATVTVVLVVMWIIGFVLPLSPDVTNIKYYIEKGVATLMIIFALRFVLKTWEKDEKVS